MNPHPLPSSRRAFLQATTAFLAPPSLNLVTQTTHANPSPAARKIFAAGGGLFSSLDPERKLLKFILSLSSKPDPVVCYLATASGDHPESIVSWYEIMNPLPCKPRHLRLFGPTNRLKPFDAQLAATDIIVVSGGNTLNMLAVWREHSLPALLKKAWENGTVLAGESAGMICWFQQGVTDSRPNTLSSMDCLGLIPGSACPHYNNPQRKPAFHHLIKSNQIQPGLACDDGCGALFEDNKPPRSFSLTQSARAYQVTPQGTDVTETPLPTTLLP